MDLVKSAGFGSTMIADPQDRHHAQQLEGAGTATGKLSGLPRGLGTNIRTGVTVTRRMRPDRPGA
jgi:hypothetical protein